MKTFYKAIITPVIVSLALVACNNSKHTEESTAADTTNSTTGTYPSNNDQMKADAQAEKSKLKAEWNEKMNDLDRQLDELDAKIDASKGNTKAEYQKRKAELKEESSTLRQKIDKAGEVTDDKWDDFKAEMDHDFSKLGSSIKDFFQDNETDKKDQK